MTPFIDHRFKSPVWRMEIDSVSNMILLETRDQSDKKVHFSSIGLETGKIHFESLETEERWLTGIETAHNGVLLVHNYQSESGPSHKGLVAIDETTGEILWQNFNLVFEQLTTNGPLLYDTRFQPKRPMLADIRTGATLRPYEPSIDLEFVYDLGFPEVVSDEFALSLHLPVHALENTVQYLEHGNRIIVSLHAIIYGELQQHLYLMTGTDVIYHDLLATSIQKLQPESFIIQKDKLIYLVNHSQLKVLNL
jgi:hypothetical protein